MVEPFDAVDVIRTQRERQTLSDDQIAWVIDAYTRGVVADDRETSSRVVEGLRLGGAAL